jgi:FKBP-type peptidyl-prolyl cis-trans isomerase (trigger factor)
MPVAETEVKFSLACSEISKLEGFELSEDELANEYIKIARKEKITEEAARNKYPKEDIEEDIFSRRAFELVKSTAVAIPMSE